MNFAFSSNAFRNFTLHDAAKAISRAGFSGIEIMCDRPHAWPDDLKGSDIENIKNILKDNNLAISNLNAFMMCAVESFHHPSWIENDPDYRMVRINYTIDCINLASELGASNISTEPGGPLNGMSKKDALEIFIQGIEMVLPHAEKKGIMLLVEPEPELLLETSDDFLNFMTHFSNKNIGLNLDAGHFFCVGEDPAQTVERLQQYTCHIHLEDIPSSREHKHIQLGDGGMDIPGILKSIENTGYKGFVTVELYPFLSDPAATAETAYKYLRKEWFYPRFD